MCYSDTAETTIVFGTRDANVHISLKYAARLCFNKNYIKEVIRVF